jgi:hypothetical protein
MQKYTSPLDDVRVAAPCPADWDRMVGDERARFCDRCSLHVYNLSGMTRREAEALVTNAEGRLCVRYYSRPDGTVLTQNCPVGLRAVRQKVARVAGAFLSAVLGFFAGVGINFGFGTERRAIMGGLAVSEPAGGAVEAPEVGMESFEVSQGVMAVPVVDYHRTFRSDEGEAARPKKRVR